MAAISVAGVALELISRYVKSDSPWQREQTLRPVEHFVPCVLAGASVTWAIVEFSPQSAYRRNQTGGKVG